MCPARGVPAESNQPSTVIGIPPEEATGPYEVMGSSVMVTHLFQDPTSGEMFIDMITYIQSIVDLGLDAAVDVHPVLTLQELPNPED